MKSESISGILKQAKITSIAAMLSLFVTITLVCFNIKTSILVDVSTTDEGGRIQGPANKLILNMFVFVDSVLFILFLSLSCPES